MNCFVLPRLVPLFTTRPWLGPIVIYNLYNFSMSTIIRCCPYKQLMQMRSQLGKLYLEELYHFPGAAY
jgi:hypothetical protein